ncbi:pyridine nucleotide-disulfide oxidoreductase [Pandoraea eparura]|jgi:NADPH-dependent 2,4-dienoyl-CoA reductase/sulfur reductase-like enzyme|uniref:Pyridine nucleotide-disulfide oxidoreductase n=1 Tax=Pandoraea eparura TaxID=2508291 RepID=A0A5E4S4N7_9BURK|nr:NAD(P)/FAD-dependent oxidoreductase [Pandoraea eparura]VVD70335.1 pyridine nucleotide-disulfide oxidoreductase [Pandoraea eparura]
MAQPRVIIIGAGPSGVRCAEALVAAGLRPTVVDENRRDGGQIYRRQPDNFTRPYAKLYGTEAERAQSLHESFDALRGKIDYLPETLAWNIADGRVHVTSKQRTKALPYDALVICAGATDRLMPVKGWHYAGTYSLGASQIALKAQACAIGRQIVFLGTGPLLYLVASQYIKAGANVVAVLDTSPFMRRVAALPKLLARPAVLRNGFALVANLKRAGVQVLTGITPLEIKGSPETGVQGVVIRDNRGNERSFECDAVGMGYHLRPETQLADLARCAFRFDHETRQWLPEVGEDGRTSVPGVYLAGDGMKVLGADGAEIGGRLAAMAVLKDFKLKVSEDELQKLRAEQAKMDRFRRGLVQAFPWPAQQAAQLPDDAIVCRCEAITAGELRRVVGETGAQEANRAKAFSRVGMGRCQGRYCGHAGAEVIAHAAGVPVEQVGRLRGQAPVKPLSIAVREEVE